MSLGYQFPYTCGSVWGGGMVEKIKLTQKKKNKKSFSVFLKLGVSIDKSKCLFRRRIKKKIYRKNFWYFPNL